jgi:hypothetical protein
MKLTTLIPLFVLALGCSSSKDDEKGASGGSGAGKGNPATGAGATGGTTGSGGSSMIEVTGGTTGTGTGGSSGTSGTGSGATSGTTGGGDAPTPDELIASECAGWSSEPELLPIVLMLVVDNSASMNDRPNGSQSTKWEITRDALGTAIDALPSTASVGVLYYPNMNTSGSDVERPINQCVNIDAMIPIELLGDAGSQQRSTIARSLTDTRPQGSTPTHDAYDYAYVNGMEASDLTGNRFMLLITDGAPTLKKGCQGGGMPNTPQPTQPIISEILGARQAGVRSFIIGSPGSESVNNVDVRPWLSEAAVDGGTARSGCSLYGPDYCHIDLSQGADFKGQLNAALARILGLITSCTFDVPATGKDGQPVVHDQVNVIYTPGGGDAYIVGRDDATDCQDGWQFDAEGRVVLCPNTCATAQNDPNGQVQLVFGCASIDTPMVK